jgi:hydrogenase nickel incorporation protein HypB
MKTPVIQRRFHGSNPIARLNRRMLRDADILTVTILGGPGCGKTSLIASTIQRLAPDVQVGVIACDIGSHRDADRIARASEQVVQVNTGEGGVVDATHIRDALDWLDLKALDLLFIEHIGTLALARVPDLGQNFSATVFSVAAGDDKADKHPELVNAADVVLLNKTDLLPSVPFDLRAFRTDVQRIKPGVELIEIAALKPESLDRWLAWLKSQVTRRTQKACHWFA